MHALIGRLEVDYRTPLVLRYWEDMSYEEIAATMGMTVAAVKSRLFRARQQLAALYQQRETAAQPPASGRNQAKPSAGHTQAPARIMHARLGMASV